MHRKTSIIFKTFTVFILILLLGTSCRSTDEKEPVITFEKYKKMAWRNKIAFLTSLHIDETNPDYPRILQNAKKDDEILIVEAYIICVAANKIHSEKKTILSLIEHPNPIIRWRSLVALSHLESNDKDLNIISSYFDDKEWLVREEAFRSIRRYETEKEKKKYFLRILLHLNERNPDVLREIIRTLKWYDDPRTYSYLVRRSYFTKSDMALIVIMQELTDYNTKTVEKRLQRINHSHKSMIAREEAARLLDRYF